MSEHLSDNEVRRVSRHWRTPPALLRNPNSPEAFEGAGILAEFDSDAGLLLWQCYRDVLLWASTPPEKRTGLFHDRTGDPASRGKVEPSLNSRLPEDALRAVRRLQRGSRQLRGDDGSIVTAAMAVATGAERIGAPATAIAYAQLSAAVDPSSASSALAVGRLALRIGHDPVAETWLRRSIALARRRRDWGTYGAALADLGWFRERNNRLADARHEYVKAMRVGRRWGLVETVGEALRGLLRVALLQDDQGAAERYAPMVLRKHRVEHPQRAGVLLEVAEVEVRRGDYERAERMLRTALSGLISAEQEVRGLVLLIRVSGFLGDWQSVECVWHRAEDMIEDAYGLSHEGVRALLVLARAGAELLQDGNADRAAQRALSYARQSGDEELIAECDAFLARARLPRAT